MTDLFTDSGAIFDTGKTRRFRLWRIWDRTKPILIGVLTNPSKAGVDENDPTAERMIRRAHMLKYGGMALVNALDAVETDSRKLDRLTSAERCSPENIKHLQWALDEAAAGRADIVCGWGKPGQKYGPVEWFITQAREMGVPLYCLVKNKDGSPKHPLYIPYSQQPIWWAGAYESPTSECRPATSHEVK